MPTRGYVRFDAASSRGIQADTRSVGSEISYCLGKKTTSILKEFLTLSISSRPPELVGRCEDQKVDTSTTEHGLSTTLAELWNLHKFLFTLASFHKKSLSKWKLAPPAQGECCYINDRNVDLLELKCCLPSLAHRIGCRVLRRHGQSVGANGI